MITFYFYNFEHLTSLFILSISFKWIVAIHGMKLGLISLPSLFSTDYMNCALPFDQDYEGEQKF